MYATRADLEKHLAPEELIQLTDDDRDGAADAGVIEQALADAQAEIDGYVATRYQLPLAETPALLRRVAVDLALARLYARRDLTTEARAKQHDDAVALLKRLADGTVTLGLTPSSRATPPPSIVSGDRLFTRARTRGF
jgi:phage gp36-like protein